MIREDRKKMIFLIIDVFVMGDDWEGKFDELSEFCEVIYLPRTKDISTTQIKSIITLITEVQGYIKSIQVLNYGKNNSIYTKF